MYSLYKFVRNAFSARKGLYGSYGSLTEDIFRTIRFLMKPSIGAIAQPEGELISETTDRYNTKIFELLG